VHNEIERVKAAATALIRGDTFYDDGYGDREQTSQILTWLISRYADNLTIEDLMAFFPRQPRFRIMFCRFVEAVALNELVNRQMIPNSVRDEIFDDAVGEMDRFKLATLKSTIFQRQPSQVALAARMAVNHIITIVKRVSKELQTKE